MLNFMFCFPIRDFYLMLFITILSLLFKTIGFNGCFVTNNPLLLANRFQRLPVRMRGTSHYINSQMSNLFLEKEF